MIFYKCAYCCREYKKLPPGLTLGSRRRSSTRRSDARDQSRIPRSETARGARADTQRRRDRRPTGLPQWSMRTTRKRKTTRMPMMVTLSPRRATGTDHEKTSVRRRRHHWCPQPSEQRRRRTQTTSVKNSHSNSARSGDQEALCLRTHELGA
jgi:hypothetical protein